MSQIPTESSLPAHSCDGAAANPRSARFHPLDPHKRRQARQQPRQERGGWGVNGAAAKNSDVARGGGGAGR